MNLLSLRYFQTVARHENVSRAAEELLVAQPSVSRTIARLEADLGAPLFERTGRQVRLNRFGAAFLTRVDRALAELDDGRRELTESVGLRRGSVAVASETLLTLTEILPAFRAEQPEVDVRLSQSGPVRMCEQLARGAIDFALASQPLDAPDLDALELVDEPVLLAVPLGHRLADTDRVRTADLVDEPVITTRGGWERVLIERLLAPHGRRPHVVCESEEPAAVEVLVASGLGVGLVPAIATRNSTAAVSRAAIEDGEARRHLRLVWRRGSFLSGAARRFREIAVEVTARAAA